MMPSRRPDKEKGASLSPKTLTPFRSPRQKELTNALRSLCK